MAGFFMPVIWLPRLLIAVEQKWVGGEYDAKGMQAGAEASVRPGDRHVYSVIPGLLLERDYSDLAACIARAKERSRA